VEILEEEREEGRKKEWKGTAKQGRDRGESAKKGKKGRKGEGR